MLVIENGRQLGYTSYVRPKKDGISWMKTLYARAGYRFCILLGLIPLLLSVLWNDSAKGEGMMPVTPAGMSREETLRLGERMYRDGILPSGEPMQAVVKGDIPVLGTAFACASCHLRSGLGSFEGKVYTPPTNGATLFKPRTMLYKWIKVIAMPHRRPAYTDASLADVLWTGVDPAGKTLDDIMPRYMLEEADMAVLIDYLKSLSANLSPGVTDTTLRLATITTDAVEPAKRDAMLAELNDYILFRNNMASAYGVGTGRVRMADVMVGARDAKYLGLSLSAWELKGPPETWRGQLEAYYSKETVFALVGGIITGDWKPVRDFSEAHKIPTLFPVTDFPVISDNDWYTMYFSKGYYQEGEGAARYLNGRDDLLKAGPVIEIVRDSPEGRDLSAGFRDTWRELGHPAPVTISLKKGEAVTAEFLELLRTREKPAVFILWDGPALLPALGRLAAADKRPEAVVLSSGYLGGTIWSLPDGLRDFTYMTYPFRLPQEEARYTFTLPFLRKGAGRGYTQMIEKQMYSLILVLHQALIDMKGNYYRDNFLDVIGMMADKKVPLYERLSFGPGQRYASKGCYIVQLTRGPNPRLIKKSDWVIH